jgi:hypothetical protein
MYLGFLFICTFIWFAFGGSATRLVFILLALLALVVMQAFRKWLVLTSENKED